MSIRLQILCSLGLMFLLSCVMFAATWTLTSQQKSEGLVINLAGRQRMQAQKIAKETLAYAHQVAGGDTSTALADTIRQRLDALTQLQNTLIHGGRHQNGATVDIPASTGATASLLQAASARIAPFRREVDTILSSGKGDTAPQLLAASDALVSAQDKAVTSLQHDAETNVSMLMIIQASGMALGAIIFVLVLFALGRSLRRPLSRLCAYAGAVAGGDLKARADGFFPPELASLRDAMARMVAALEDKMGEAREKGREAESHAAEADAALETARRQEQRSNELLARMHDAAGRARGVSTSMLQASSELLGESEQVAEGARQQRDRMIETATAMEEMNATVLEVARNAGSAAASADAARGKAVTGAEGVCSAVASIETIRQRILDLRESMTRLGQQADNIGSIMNVISDIADQTNLLALNAAIEAARAGEAGRGFAVVADEVRKLAEKTMTATKEVGEAVLSIQGQARENIAAVESAASGIEESTQAAAASGRFMDEIVGIVESTAAEVTSIATASEEQSATSEEINRAVEEVNRIAGETAAGMETAITALTTLSQLTGELDDVIRGMTGEAEAGNLKALQASRTVSRALSAPQPARPRALGPSPAPVARAKAAIPSRPVPAKPRALAAAPRPKASTAPAGKGDGPVACSIGSGILQWDDSLSVGIKDIDEQHQKLVQMICDLHEAMRTGQGKEHIEPILRELEEYAVEHFGFEEKLMERFTYPGYLNHRKEHEKFVDKVIAFGNDFRENRAALTTEVMNFLKNWLVGHIKGTDKKYGPFFNDRGVR